MDAARQDIASTRETALVIPRWPLNYALPVPSLWNIELTGPYMHDGRFSTWEEVVEFYNSGVVNNPNLSPPSRNRDGTVRRLNLTAAQKVGARGFPQDADGYEHHYRPAVF